MTTASNPWWVRRVGGLLLAFALAPAGAQYLQIPDFRNPPASATATRPAEPCSNCGVIRAIRETQSQRSMAVPQGIQNPQMSGGPETSVRIGAVVALPMSDGNDQMFVGGVGTPEMRERFSESNYEITVLLDTGGYAIAQRRDGARYRVGDRVRMRGVDLELLNR